MHSVRKRILELLKERDGATVAELAKSLGMASVSVRHHLDILQGDNLICVAKVARKGNVGRPQQIYGLTEEAEPYFPDNFATLSSSLVRQLKAVLPPEKVHHAFRTMASEMAGDLGNRNASDTSPEEHLDGIVSYLNERGYLARWEHAEERTETGGGEGSEEAEGSGYLLHKYNCPYFGVSGEHPELCMMDQMLVDELVGCPCKRTHSMAENQHCCTYFIPVTELN